MSEHNPVTKKHLLAKVGQSLKAQQALRDRMAQVAAEAAAAREQLARQARQQ